MKHRYENKFPSNRSDKNCFALKDTSDTSSKELEKNYGLRYIAFLSFHNVQIIIGCRNNQPERVICNLRMKENAFVDMHMNVKRGIVCITRKT